MSRVARIVKWFRYWPHEALRRWPEQATVGLILFSVATASGVYKFATVPVYTLRPWYRGRYDVVRPDAEIASTWRVPEDYPAPFESNRLNYSFATYKKDYGFKLSI